MNKADFDRKSPGKLIETNTGYLAYIPDPLPPQIEWTEQIISLLGQAERSLSALAEAGKTFPVPHLVAQSIIRQEAVTSSRIEGTRTTLEGLLTYEARQLSYLDDPDAFEVQNYVKALDYGLERLETLPISQRLIREIHSRLMQGVRGEFATPGEFRRSQNWIGAPGATLENANYVPPPVDEMKVCLSDLEKFIHTEIDIPDLARIALVHYQFEAIHPFLDGNGRIGRLLISLLLTAWGLLPQPLLYLSAYFEQHRSEYYSHLLSISQRGEWEAWLVFFLTGLAAQSKSTYELIEHLSALQENYRGKFEDRRNAVALSRAVDSFIGHPIQSIRQLQTYLNLNNYQSAKRLMDELVSYSIVETIGTRSRNRLYCAREILNAIQQSPAP